MFSPFFDNGDETPEQKLARVTRNTMPLSLLNLSNTPSDSLNAMPNPQAATMPTINAPKQPFMDRMLAHLFPMSPAMQSTGLLTPDEVNHSRWNALIHAGAAMSEAAGPTTGAVPSLGQIIGRGLDAGNKGYDEAINGATQSTLFANQVAQMQRQQELRKRIGEATAPQPGESPEQRMERLVQMYDEYLRAGDVQSATALNPAVQQILARGKTPERSLQHVDLGDRVQIIDPVSGRVIREVPKGLTPKTPSEVDASMKRIDDQRNKILDDFRAATKDFPKAKEGYNVLIGARKSPGIATPFAMTDAYARITNPNGVVRPTTQEMIEGLGSVGQRMRKYWEKNAHGSLPNDILDDFTRTMHAILVEHKSDYDEERRLAILRAKEGNIPGVEKLMPNYDLPDPVAAQPGNDLLGLLGGGAGPASPGAAAGAGNANNVYRFLKK